MQPNSILHDKSLLLDVGKMTLMLVVFMYATAAFRCSFIKEGDCCHLLPDYNKCIVGKGNYQYTAEYLVYCYDSVDIY